jgi:Ras-related protein Rab-2A
MSKEFKVEVLNKDPGNLELSFKILIIGDSSVGKSCLALRATKGSFNTLYTPTVGFEFFNFYLKIEEEYIKLQIWDTCGQEVYRSLISSFYRNSSLAIIVYAIDNLESFNNIENWLNELKTKGNPDISIILVGNKLDLEDKRQITKEMNSDFCDNHNIRYFFETSAKTGFNAKNVFIEAAKILYEEHLKLKDRVSRPESFSRQEDSNPELSLDVGVGEENDINNKNLEKRSGCCF